MENLTLKQFFASELQAKKRGEWFVFVGFVEGVYLAIKQFRSVHIHQQILKIGYDNIDYSAGHTLRTVREFKAQITELIEKQK